MTESTSRSLLVCIFAGANPDELREDGLCVFNPALRVCDLRRHLHDCQAHTLCSLASGFVQLSYFLHSSQTLFVQLTQFAHKLLANLANFACASLVNLTH